MNTNNQKTHSSCCHHGEQKSSFRFDFIFHGSLIIVTLLYCFNLLNQTRTIKIDWLNVMAHTAYHMINTLWYGIVAAIIFVGIMAKIPRRFIMSILGEGGTFSGLVRAVSAGVLLDLCSHGILMVATKLYERGASIGQVIAFLLASPWNSISLTIILFSLIGSFWTISFILLSMVIALISGWIFDKLVSHNILPKNPNHILLDKNFTFWSEAKSALKATKFDQKFFTSMLVSGIKDSKIVIKWLLFGILLASLIRAFIDLKLFETLFGPTGFGLLITIIAATILEVCSEGSTPIAADILTRAKAPGNSFAFLMSGVSTDYTEIMVLKETTKSWKISLFLPLVTLPQIIVIAYLINA